jgi:hypothetical protein
VRSAWSNPGRTSIRAEPIAITIAALDVPAPRSLPLVALGVHDLVGRTRIIRTCGRFPGSSLA